MDRADMTHPLTPREKVEQAVKDAIREDAGVGLQMTLTPRFIRGLVDRVLAATSVVDHEAGLVSDKPAALASGSGDHAELARLVESLRRGKVSQGDRIRVATLSEALLAEIAALRDEHVHLVEQKEGAEDALFNALSRATEAERKLAEAEEESCRWVFRFAEVREASGIGVKPMLSEVPGELRKMRSLIDRAADLMRQCTDPERFEGASTLNVYANMRAWLSDLPPAPGAEA